MPGFGACAISGGCEQVGSLPLKAAEGATDNTPNKLDISIVSAQHAACENKDTAGHYEACLVGENLIPVDVTVEELSGALTKITVTARPGWLTPEHETAREILARTVERAAAAGRGSSPTTHGRRSLRRRMR